MPGLKYTLITGASMGIGRAFAFECAKRGMNLFLVALPDAALDETKEQLLKEHSVDVVCFGINLTEPDAAKTLMDYCVEKNLTINILINNAGIGAGGRFENISPQFYLNMLNLNIQALTLLTYYFLSMLKQQEAAYILNMSSLEATLPLPYKTVYTGTKNYIYSFSLALREELAFSKVSVSVLCPGPVLTNPDGLKRMNAHGNKAKYVMLMPDQVAQMGVENLIKGRGVIVPGKINWAIVKLTKLFPTPLKMKLLERLFRVYRDH